MGPPGLGLPVPLIDHPAHLASRPLDRVRVAHRDLHPDPDVVQHLGGQRASRGRPLLLAKARPRLHLDGQVVQVVARGEHELEERAGLHAVDIYGLSEVMGPGVAVECVESKDGLTVWEDHFYPELINPRSGAPAAAGERGEILFTSLTKQAMPLVRYRTRDLTRLLPGTARPGHRRMERVTGRSDDMIVLRGVNVFPTQIEELLLRIPGLAPHFQLVLTSRDHLDELTVHVEARPGLAEEQRSAAARALAAQVLDHVGVRVQVAVGDPDTIERSAGKMRRVVDQRGR